MRVENAAFASLKNWSFPPVFYPCLDFCLTPPNKVLALTQVCLLVSVLLFIGFLVAATPMYPHFLCLPNRSVCGLRGFVILMEWPCQALMHNTQLIVGEGLHHADDVFHEQSLLRGMD